MIDCPTIFVMENIVEFGSPDSFDNMSGDNVPSHVIDDAAVRNVIREQVTILPHDCFVLRGDF